MMVEGDADARWIGAASPGEATKNPATGDGVQVQPFHTRASVSHIKT